MMKHGSEMSVSFSFFFLLLISIRRVLRDFLRFDVYMLYSSAEIGANRRLGRANGSAPTMMIKLMTMMMVIMMVRTIKFIFFFTSKVKAGGGRGS